VSLLLKEGVIEAVAYDQLACYGSAVKFARSESWVMAPESSHAAHAAVVEALKCKESGEKKVILFNLSGNGYLDMAGYDAYFAGQLQDYVLPEEDIEKGLATVPKL